MTARQSARARRRRHEEAVDWLLRNRENRQSSAAAPGFQAWLEQDAENRQAYAAAERLMGEARTAILAEPALRDLPIPPRRSVTKPVLSVLLGLALAGGAFYAADGPMRLQADAISGSGETPTIMLADGSSVQLNASSALAYEFTPTGRTVRLLRGEGFFQVAKDPARPFSVEAGGGRTTARGTAFNIRLGDRDTDVTVTEHAVSVTPLGAGVAGVDVAEGQRIAYGADGRLGAVTSVDPATVTAWRRGQLVVDNATLAEVVDEIGRHFSGRIVLAGSDLAGRRVSGTFAISDPMAALHLLEESLGLTATRIGPLIVIRG